MPAIKSYPTRFSPEQRRAYDTLASDYYEELVPVFGYHMLQQDYIKYMSCGRTIAIRDLKDVPYQLAGKQKRYRTLDIARYLAENRVGLNLQNFEGYFSDTDNLSVPDRLSEAFVSICKERKMNKDEIIETGILIIKRFNKAIADKLRKGTA